MKLTKSKLEIQQKLNADKIKRDAILVRIKKLKHQKEFFFTKSKKEINDEIRRIETMIKANFNLKKIALQKGFNKQASNYQKIIDNLVSKIEQTEFLVK